MGYRVGIDGHVLDGKSQGTKTFLKGVLGALAASPQAHAFTVYCFNPQQRRAELQGASLEFRALRHHNPLSRLCYEFPRLMRRDGIDVGIFQYIAPPFAAMRNILVVHDLLPFTHPGFFPLAFRARMAALMPRSIARAAAIITGSEATRAAILERFPRGTPPVHLLPDGPSFPLDAVFAPRGSEVEPLPHQLRPGRYILTVGRIEPRKNLDLLVRAFLRAALDDIDLVLVGQQDMGYGWRPPSHPRIRHVEGADDKTVLRLHRAAGLFVYPSLAEGFGIPLLDSVLLGTPTLSSNQTSMPEAGGDLAAYFDPTASDAEQVLAERLAAHFRGNPIPAPDIAARKLHAERFSWQAAAERLVEVVDTV
jgi:glycosyltransferase involved in cell wall biosynthesis